MIVDPGGDLVLAWNDLPTGVTVRGNSSQSCLPQAPGTGLLLCLFPLRPLGKVQSRLAPAASGLQECLKLP